MKLLRKGSLGETGVGGNVISKVISFYWFISINFAHKISSIGKKSVINKKGFKQFNTFIEDSTIVHEPKRYKNIHKLYT